MKEFKLIIDTSTLTKIKMEKACKFLDEIDSTDGFTVNPDTLTITFDDNLENSLLTIANEYDIVDLTKL